MSIIDDALKKVQDEIKTKFKPPAKTAPEPEDRTPVMPTAPAASSGPATPSRKPDTPKIILLTACLVIIVVLFSMILIIANYATQSQPQAAALKDLHEEPAASETEAFNISGVSVIEGKKVVLIEDKIYEVGDNFDNMEIVDIDLDAVKVRTTTGLKTIKIR